MIIGVFWFWWPRATTTAGAALWVYWKWGAAWKRAGELNAIVNEAAVTLPGGGSMKVKLGAGLRFFAAWPLGPSEGLEIVAKFFEAIGDPSISLEVALVLLAIGLRGKWSWVCFGFVVAVILSF